MSVYQRITENNDIMQVVELWPYLKENQEYSPELLETKIKDRAGLGSSHKRVRTLVCSILLIIII